MYSKHALLAAVLVQVLPTFGAIHDKLAALPTGWAHVATPATESTMRLQIGLAQENIDQLESKLTAVSTPGNSEYGQHLDVDDVNALFAPSAATTTAVQSWLTGAGITQQELSSDGHWIYFSTTVGSANALLNTTFLTYENSGVSKLRTTQYSIPDILAQHIDLIIPTTYFGKTVANLPMVPAPSKTKRTEASQSTIDASCQTSITPGCLKQLYNIGDYKPDPNSGSRLGFGSFLNQSAIYSDLSGYETLFGIPAQNFSVVLINGATNDQDVSTAQYGEANLDVQNQIGVAHPLPVTEFITGGSPPFNPNLDEPTAADNENEPYVPYYQYLLSQPNSAIPQVISNSYGDDEQTVPKSYAIRACNMIGMLGLRGVSVLESSGDTGVGAPCRANDGSNAVQFTPQFPGTCPYITSVGGTQAVTPEVAWVDGSGGFSNYFPRAWYQELAIEEYLNEHITAATKKYYQPYTNFNGRGFPDISAHSLTPYYQVIEAGVIRGSGGTSAAAPVVASILALLNDARLRAGKSTLGFVNPLLYAIGFSALNDITGGGAVGCNGVNGQTGQPIPGGGVIPWATWNATVGWDPVTGLGTPNFQKLKALVLTF